MKTVALIATATLAGSIAFAGGQQYGAKQPSAMLNEVPHHSLQNATLSMTLPSRGSARSVTSDALAADQCAIGEPLSWFTKARRLPECFAQRWGQASLLQRGHVVADLDLDGKDDHLLPMHFRDDGSGCASVHSDLWQWDGANCAVASEYPLLWKPVTVYAGGAMTLTLRAALSVGDIVKAFTSADLEDGTFDYSTFPYLVRLMDLHDLDDDGDLDLVMYAHVTAWPNEEGQPTQNWNGLFWLENSAAFAPPVAADINRDGRVDGADLSMLLAAWGPNP